MSSLFDKLPDEIVRLILLFVYFSPGKIKISDQKKALPLRRVCSRWRNIFDWKTQEKSLDVDTKYHKDIWKFLGRYFSENLTTLCFRIHTQGFSKMDTVLRLCPNIHTLDLSCLSVPLDQLYGFKNLTSLTLGHCNTMDVDFLNNLFKSCPRLSILCGSICYHFSFSKVTQNPNLTRLELYPDWCSDKIDFSDLKEIFPNLTSLSINYFDVTELPPSGISDLTLVGVPLRQYPVLEECEKLTVSFVDDHFLKILSDSCQKLTSLTILSGDLITDEGLMFLSSLQNLSHFQLSMAGLSSEMITETGMEVLAKMPKMRCVEISFLRR
jgi:hypothetical protein